MGLALVMLNLAMAPPLTFVPPLPHVDAAPILPKAIDIPPISIMSPEDELQKQFGERWVSKSAAIDTPAMYDDMAGELIVVPPFTFSVGQQLAQVDARDMEAKPLRSVAPTAKKPHDVCSKYGRKKVWYTRDKHKFWRCAVT